MQYDMEQTLKHFSSAGDMRSFSLLSEKGRPAVEEEEKQPFAVASPSGSSAEKMHPTPRSIE